MKGGYQIVDADLLLALKTNETKDVEVYEQVKCGKPLLLVSATNGTNVWADGVYDATTKKVAVYVMPDFTTISYTVSPDGSVE